MEVKGSALKGDVLGGPELCFKPFPYLCNQPNIKAQLAIKLINPVPPQEYSVTPFAEEHGLISPGIAQRVKNGSTITFTATPEMGYGVQDWFVDEKQIQKGGTTFQLSNITAEHNR